MKLLPDEKYYSRKKILSFERFGNAAHWKKLKEDSGVYCLVEGKADGWWAVSEYILLTDQEAKEAIVKERSKVFGYNPILVWD